MSEAISMEFDDIIKSLIDIRNKDVDEYNDLAILYDQSQVEIETLSKWKKEAEPALEAQHKAIETQVKNEAEIKSELQKQINLAEMYKDKSEVTQHQLNTLRKEHKTLKEQVKRLKASSSEKDKRLKRLESANKSKKGGHTKLDANGFVKEDETGRMHTIWNHGDEYILVYPDKLTLKYAGNKESEQYVLLYTNKTGMYLTGMINEDDQCCWSSPVIFDKDTPERTRNLVGKFIAKPSELASEFAEQWLYRVNRMQGGRMKASDFKQVVQ